MDEYTADQLVKGFVFFMLGMSGSAYFFAYLYLCCKFIWIMGRGLVRYMNRAIYLGKKYGFVRYMTRGIYFYKKDAGLMNDMAKGDVELELLNEGYETQEDDDDPHSPHCILHV